jgi:hypothetical protein
MYDEYCIPHCMARLSMIVAHPLLPGMPKVQAEDLHKLI